MRRYIAFAVTLSALASAAPVLAQSQLASSAGLSNDEARGLTLTEIAAVKFNRDQSNQDGILVRGPAAVTNMAFQDSTGVSGRNQLIRAAGLSPEQAEGMTLNEIAAAKANRDLPNQDQILVREPGTVTSMAFQDPIDVSSHYQLIRGARLTPEQAEGMTLNEIVHIISPD